MVLQLSKPNHPPKSLSKSWTKIWNVFFGKCISYRSCSEKKNFLCIGWVLVHSYYYITRSFRVWSRAVEWASIAHVHSGPENLKKSRPKRLVKSSKSISWNISLTKFHSLPFKNGKISIFELGKSFKKLPKMQFHLKHWFIWCHEFFWLDFF